MDLKLEMAIVRTLSFVTAGFIVGELVTTIASMTSGNFCFPDSYYTSTILIMTGLVLFMFVLNVICCSKILNDKNLADLVPSKVIGANLSLHALLLTGAIALSIIALKDVQLGGIACTVLFSLLTALSIALAIAFSSLNLRIS